MAEAGTVNSGSLVAVLGNSYSVPIVHVGAPVTVRVYRERIVIWRDAEHLATHERAPDGAHRRVVEPSHFAPVFERKPRAQVMLYREALLGLGTIATQYVSELSRRHRARLAPEVLAIHALYQRRGAVALLAAMAQADQRGAYGAAYLEALLEAPPRLAEQPIRSLPTLTLPSVPSQAEVDRHLSSYERYVHITDALSEPSIAVDVEVPA